MLGLTAASTATNATTHPDKSASAMAWRISSTAASASTRVGDSRSTSCGVPVITRTKRASALEWSRSNIASAFSRAASSRSKSHRTKATVNHAAVPTNTNETGREAANSVAPSGTKSTRPQSPCDASATSKPTPYTANATPTCTPTETMAGVYSSTYTVAPHRHATAKACIAKTLRRTITSLLRCFGVRTEGASAGGSGTGAFTGRTSMGEKCGRSHSP